MIHLESRKPLSIYPPNVYRYMGKEFIDLFFDKGILRISSFKKFKEYPDEVRGDKQEGSGSVIGTSDLGFQLHTMTNTGNDAYMLCGSIIESDTIMEVFKTDGCFRIIKPFEFSIAVSNAIVGHSHSFQGFCNYRDHRMIKKLIQGMSIKDFTRPDGTIVLGGEKGNQRIDEVLANGVDLMFLKERKYQNQCEYRFIWKVNSQFYSMSDYIDIECKEAVQFCERMD